MYSGTLNSAPGGRTGLVLSAISRGPKLDQQTQQILVSKPYDFSAWAVTLARMPQGQALQAPAKTGRLAAIPKSWLPFAAEAAGVVRDGVVCGNGANEVSSHSTTVIKTKS